ncbi:hypothetical protein N7534_003395 [Penicillium rubens]|nr:hypothetical protein N7534_003395 [Penicillium rubens]
MVTTRDPAALTDLPLELLWMISEHLSLVDLACLALGNHRLLSSLAGTAFRDFTNTNGRNGNPTDDARIKLLSRLSRDLPQYYLCFICLRLHLWKNTRLPGYFHIGCSDGLEMKDQCLQTRLPLCFYPSYTFYHFRFVHLQLAMRRFYHGPRFGIPVESMLYTEVARHHMKAKAPSLVATPRQQYIRKGSPKRRSDDTFLCRGSNLLYTSGPMLEDARDSGSSTTERTTDVAVPRKWTRGDL